MFDTFRLILTVHISTPGVLYTCGRNDSAGGGGHGSPPIRDAGQLGRNGPGERTTAGWTVPPYTAALLFRTLLLLALPHDSAVRFVTLCRPVARYHAHGRRLLQAPALPHTAACNVAHCRAHCHTLLLVRTGNSRKRHIQFERSRFCAGDRSYIFPRHSDIFRN
jgi:hypothetical protein